MKRIINQIILLSITICVQAQVDDPKEVYSKNLLPIELESSSIYIEKFSPIYIQDLTEGQLEKLGITEGEGDMDGFLNVLSHYNTVLYRKFNASIMQSVGELNEGSVISPIYLRDFNEVNNDSIRYIISNNYSIVDLYLRYKNGYSKDDNFGYYIYDKQSKEHYNLTDNLSQMLLRLNKYNKLYDNGKLNKMDQLELNSYLSKVEYKPKKEKKYSNAAWGAVVFSSLAIITNFILNN